MKNEKVIIERGRYWRCENLDLLAPIIEEGECVLFSDNEMVCVSDDATVLPDNLKNTIIREATEEEYHEYYHKQGFIFKGDKIVVTAGRKIPVGTTKEVKGFSRYEVPGTYGHKYTNYVLFTDGTKTDINNIRVMGFEDVENVFEFTNGYNIGGRL